MKDDYSMITRCFDRPVTVYPIADAHYGAISHNEKAWTEFLCRVESEDAYLILNGDLINNNTRSSVGSPFDDLVRPREQKARMVEYLKPVRDRILCMTSGNHENRSSKDADDDVMYDIASKLDIEDVYRRDAAFLKIGIGTTNRGKGRENTPQQVYCIAVTHGAGGGIYTGATVNRNERWGNLIEGVDLVVVGHTHKATVTRPAKLVFDPRTSKVEVREYLVISCCAWQSYSGYALQKMLLPSVSSKPQKLIFKDGRKKQIECIW